MARLKLSLLGSFQVFLDGKPITGFESNKVRALLAYLAVEAERPQRRAFLADLIWPGWPQRSAMRNLTFALGDLRRNISDRQAQPPFLLINRDSLQLNAASNVQVDLWDFTRLVKPPSSVSADRLSQINRLKSAIDLYLGSFMEGFSLADSAPFEEWLAATRQHISQQMVQILGELAGVYLEEGEYEQGLLYARRRVELEPWLEEGHQQLMRLLALSGQRSLALAQYEICRKALQEEFGIEPGSETLALSQQIRDGSLARSIPPQEPPPAPATPPPKPRHNLPLQLTRIFGREQDIERVKARLDKSRLATLTGAGGVGKTRLSLEVAATLVNEFVDGVWYIELAPLSDPDLVSKQVAVVLGVREEPTRPILDGLTSYLKNRQALLVLDNCEHLLEACSHLADSLLHACPRVKILATSREPLGVAGEAIYRVPSLPFPDPAQVPSLEVLEGYASIRLFIDRARLVLLEFQIQPENISALAYICQRLDGIPLAIELAAARASVLSIEELASRLDDAFHLLTGGNRSAIPRHQTLRATLDWSYRLLNDRESRLLCRLAIFEGGWDLAGVEGVCAGAGLERSEILDLLANLVNKSMVVAASTRRGGTRYRLLETIRQYAREKLVKSGELAALQQQHLAYFITLAETIEPLEIGPRINEWQHQLADEIENIRLALTTGLKVDPQAGLRLASAVDGLWGTIGRDVEGERWLKDYLDCPENAARTARRGRALWQFAGHLLFFARREEAARESFEIFHDMNDRLGQGQALFFWGLSTLFREDFSDSSSDGRMHLEAAEAIFEEFQEHNWLASTQWYLAFLAHNQCDGPMLFAYLEKALANARIIGYPNQIARILGLFGFATYQYLGDLRRARILLAEAGNPPNGTATVLCWQGEFDQARQIWEEMRDAISISDLVSDIHITNLKIGRWICWQGKLETGITLMAEAVRNLRESSSINLLAYQQPWLMELAYAYTCLGEFSQAEKLIDEFGQYCRADQYQSQLMNLLGFLAFRKGQGEESLRCFQESLKYAVKMGRLFECLLALEGYAWALYLFSKPNKAARFLGAAAEFRTRVGAKVFPRDRPVYDQVVAKLKVSLGEAGYATPWKGGQSQGFDKAIEDAIRDG